jgi:hypothetical protein
MENNIDKDYQSLVHFQDMLDELIRQEMENLPDDGLFPNYSDSDIYRSGILKGIEITNKFQQLIFKNYGK